jgi:hypothetical protein
MEAPMTNSERRQAPRIAFDMLTYINLEPGNGGMTLNISEGGLGFRAVVPVQKGGTIHVRLSEPNLRIEADAVLAWSDETQKKGGLRFINLSEEARRQVRHWISQPEARISAARELASLISVPETASSGATQRHFKTAHSSALPPAAVALPAKEVPLERREKKRLFRGFSGGLATGLLISALAGGVMLLNTHRDQFGELLVRWGQRLEAKPVSPTVAVEPRTVQQERLPVPAPAVNIPASGFNTVSAANEGISQPVPTLLKRKSLMLKAPRPMLSSRVADDDASAKSAAELPPESESLNLPAPDVSMMSGSHAPVFPTGTRSIASNRIETSKDTGGGLPPERYLEVGKSKERLWADQTKNQLAQLGLPAIVTQKRRLWSNSFHVLVGPYGNDHEIEAVEKGLVSRGFKPRSFEKGSRYFALPPGLTLNGASVPAGDCTVSWESYVSNAVVKFEKEHSVVVSVDGKLATRSVWYDRNALVYRINLDGSRNLLEIRPGATNQALVFGTAY